VSGTDLPFPRPRRGIILNGPSAHDWVTRYDTVIVLTLAAVPLAVLIGHLLVRWRVGHAIPLAVARRRTLAEVGLVHGTVPWVWLTMLPATTVRGDRALSLVPLRDLSTMPAYQVGGNLLVLAALGLFGPVRFRLIATLPRVLALAFAVSGLIETSQYALALGRVASIDDVLLNVTGAGLAALVSRPWWVSRAASPAARTPGRRGAAARSARPRTGTG
jgi:hypothetical protein